METSRIRRPVAGIVAVAVWLATQNAWANTAARLIVSRTTVRLPIVSAYLDVRDENGAPMSVTDADLGRLGVTAALDGRRLPLTALRSLDDAGDGVAYFFLVDVSKSLRPAQFSEIRRALAAWLERVQPRDRVAIASFGESYRVLLDFTADTEAARRALDSLASTDRRTVLYQALNNALTVARRDDQDLPARRVVVILSDGKDEGSGVTIDDLRAEIQGSHVPIYAIGYSNLQGDERQRHLDSLHRLATLSDGFYREATAGSIAPDYLDLDRAIRGVWIASFSCAECRLSEHARVLTIDVASRSATISTSARVGVETSPWWRRFPTWSYIATIVLALGVVLAGFGFRRRRATHIEVGPSTVPGPTIPGPTVPEFTAPQSLFARPITLATIKGVESGRVHRIRLVEKARIGRSRECDVVVRDDEVSGHHCELVLAHGNIVVLKDLGSSNGTLVNGAHVVNQSRIENGDVIRLGRTELRFGIDQPEVDSLPVPQQGGRASLSIVKRVSVDGPAGATS